MVAGRGFMPRPRRGGSERKRALEGGSQFPLQVDLRRNYGYKFKCLYSILCGYNFMTKIHGNGFAPFRFLTPFPHRPSRRLRNSALKECHFQPDVRTQSFFIRLILTCSNILGGRFHRLPSIDDLGRLNLQGRLVHFRVFYTQNFKEKYSI